MTTLREQIDEAAARAVATPPPRKDLTNCDPCKEKMLAKMKAARKEPEAIHLVHRTSPGDIVCMTAAVRDLHRAYGDRYRVSVDTPAMEIWENNPFVHDRTPESRQIDCQYPAIHQSDSRPLHFCGAFHEFLGETLGIDIPITEFKGDIHLSDDERGWTNQIAVDFGYDGPFWLIAAGGKMDFTAKWWPTEYYQQVVNHLTEDGFVFVQIGQNEHHHPALENVLDLRGKTDTRQLIRLVYHAQGIVCPVTFPMHLAAAVPRKGEGLRACVVIAGGREPVQWEAYPGHQFLHTIGQLDCCQMGGCWRSRCEKANDGDEKDTVNVCAHPVDVGGIKYPKCMTMIKPGDVICAIHRWLDGMTIDTAPEPVQVLKLTVERKETAMFDRTFEARGVKAGVRPGTWDDAIFNQIVKQDGYHITKLSKENGEVSSIVDVGACTGLFSLLAHQLWPEARIGAFEACETNFKALVANTEDVEQIERHRFAVTDRKDGVLKFAPARMQGQALNTGSGHVEGFYGPDGQNMVAVPNLHAVQALAPYFPIDLLKLDCEGAEAGILEALKSWGLLKAVKHIRGEWHGDEQRERLCAVLEETHDATISQSRGLGAFSADLKEGVEYDEEEFMQALEKETT